MAGHPRENVKDKGFWEGGAGGHGSNKESSGRPSGHPGTRRQRRVGISTDIEFPDEKQIAGDEQEGKVTR
jgi:hypothetical protein